MMRFVSALVLGLALAASPPAAAQQQEPSVASVRATLSDMAAWMLEYSIVLDRGGELMDNLDEFVAILEQFDAGEINERTALARLDAAGHQAPGAGGNGAAATQGQDPRRISPLGRAESQEHVVRHCFAPGLTLANRPDYVTLSSGCDG